MRHAGTIRWCTQCKEQGVASKAVGPEGLCSDCLRDMQSAQPVEVAPDQDVTTSADRDLWPPVTAFVILGMVGVVVVLGGAFLAMCLFRQPSGLPNPTAGLVALLGGLMCVAGALAALWFLWAQLLRTQQR